MALSFKKSAPFFYPQSDDMLSAFALSINQILLLMFGNKHPSATTEAEPPI